MIECKIADIECKNTGMCCFTCDERNNCDNACGDYASVDDYNKLGCEEAKEVKDELIPFENAYADVLKNVAELSAAKKSIDAQMDEVKTKLKAAMEEYGITSHSNDYFKVTYKKASTRTSIDSARLKKELPEIAEKYSKTSDVKASISIEVK